MSASVLTHYAAQVERSTMSELGRGNGVPVQTNGNRILAGLDPDELERIEPYLQLVELSVRDPLWQANQPISAVYFPITSVNSIIALDEQGGEVEVGTVGNEGLV